jgi:hypothetical protein
MGHDCLEVLRRRDVVRADYPDQSADSDRGGVRSGIEYRSADPGGQPGGTESSGLAPVEKTVKNRYRLRWREAVRDPSTAFAMLTSLRMTGNALPFCHPERSEGSTRSDFFSSPGDAHQVLEQGRIADTDRRTPASNRWLLPGPGYRFHRDSILMRPPTFGFAVALRPPVSARLKFAFTAIAQSHPHLQPQSDPESNASVSLGALASAFRV